MSFNRRKFIKLGSIAVAGIPLSSFTDNEWYDPLVETTQNKSDDLFSVFSNPGNQAKPFVRWWWNGNRIEKNEIIRELDLLKEIGIGGVEINPIAFPSTADPMHYKAYDWLSDEWTDLLKVTVDAAKERGIICDIIVGSGWPFGGEFLTKEEQTQMIALGTKNFSGPGQYVFEKADLEKSVDPPIAGYNPDKHKELYALRLVPARLDEFQPGTRLNHMVSDDKIIIDVPEGEHILYYLIKFTGFESVIHGAPGAKGPVLNHYNKTAVEKYLNRMSDAINSKLGSMQGNLRSLFSDSFELEGANWCDDMAVEFKKRNGYDLEPYHPFILFHIVGHAFLADEQNGTRFSPEAQEIINNVRYDFETTRMQLFNERFYQTYLSWCKKNGVKSRSQAYGMEFHPVEGVMPADYPECESWIKPDVGEVFPDYEYMNGRAYRPVNKLVTSGARLAGKRLIGCEEATNTQLVFNATLERLKITGDQSNISGITHSIFHGFNYSPKNAPFPGWVRYGTFINERNTLWPFFKTWFAYKTRLSAVFQNAEMFADIAVLLPFADVWKGYGTDWYPRPQKARPSYAHNVWEAIHQNGNACDCVSENILQNSRFERGTIRYGNRKYKYLILVEVESMQPETAAALRKFAASGGQIICLDKWPDKAAGLRDYDVNTRKVIQEISRIREKYPTLISLYPAPKNGEKIIEWYKKLQDKYLIKPYVKIDNPNAFVSQIYYKTEDRDIFFLANFSSSRAHEFNAEFAVENKIANIWDPEKGERSGYPSIGKPNKLAIRLGPAESKLIVFEQNKSAAIFSCDAVKFQKSISGAWNLTLNHMNGKQDSRILVKLTDFKTDKSLVTFAGTAVYQKDFTVDDPGKFRYLDLGKVYGVTEVTVNGKFLGKRWYGEHIYSLQNLLVRGKNSVIIHLTTTMGNYIKSLTDNPTAMNWVKKRPLYSQGIIGPVTLA